MSTSCYLGLGFSHNFATFNILYDSHMMST